MSGKESLLINSQLKNLGKLITYIHHSHIRIELVKLIKTPNLKNVLGIGV